MKINTYIDYTLLKPDATDRKISDLCSEAIMKKYCSVCVNPCFVSYASSLLRDTGVSTATVIGFPLGAVTTGAKAYEAGQAVSDGANELDMVINISRLKAGDYDYVMNEINTIASFGVVTKVIIETCLLTNAEKIKAGEIVRDSAAEFIKTSTGFSHSGATAYDVALLNGIVKANGKKVKASGGIRSIEDAVRMIEAGASRIGTSKLL